MRQKPMLFLRHFLSPILEGDSIPGRTANCLVPKAAKALGLSFPDMCALLMEDAAARYSL